MTLSQKVRAKEGKKGLLSKKMHEMEAMEHPGNVTPPPHSTRRNGPAAGTTERARALELKDAKEKALEA
jgi:hypothetical protein